MTVKTMVSSMNQLESNTRTSAEISGSVVREESDVEPKSEKTETTETETGGAEIPADSNGVDDVEPRPKSLAFKLAFIGLAASVFVFQVDATALGIALPVSNNNFLSPSSPNASLTARRLTSMMDHSW